MNEVRVETTVEANGELHLTQFGVRAETACLP